jgi:phage terminase large subunit-like protein
MQTLEKSGEKHRIAQPIRRVDEDRCVYDVTTALMEEMLFFPFAPKDDLVDAVSRIYDMDPIGPAIHEDERVQEINKSHDFIDA